MTAFDLSSSVWVDPLVVAFILAAMYAPLKDFYQSHTKRHKDRQVKLDQMLDDWVGEPARPGFDSVPGIPERVHRLETDIATVKHEVQFNSGHSIKDVVHKMSETLDHATETLDAHLIQSTVIQGEMIKKLDKRDGV